MGIMYSKKRAQPMYPPTVLEQENYDDNSQTTYFRAYIGECNKSKQLRMENKELFDKLEEMKIKDRIMQKQLLDYFSREKSMIHRIKELENKSQTI